MVDFCLFQGSQCSQGVLLPGDDSDNDDLADDSEDQFDDADEDIDVVGISDVSDDSLSIPSPIKSNSLAPTNVTTPGNSQ